MASPVDGGVGSVTAFIRVRGAREHNLKDVTVELPRGRISVITGPSGSGKSSLAFDTIYAESQRRYVESLSLSARQALHQMPKPDCDAIEGLSPAIAVQQVSPPRGPRATVGTLTEIHDHLQLLFSRLGQPHCPVCGRALHAHSAESMVDDILDLPAGTRFSIQAPLGVGPPASFRDAIADLKQQGFVRLAVDGKVHDIAEALPSARGDIAVDVQVDRLSIKEGIRARLADSVELALRITPLRQLRVACEDRSWTLSELYLCPEHGRILDALSPKTFSFHSPKGACPACHGLGEAYRFVPERIVPDPSLSIAKGAIAPWGKPNGAYHRSMVKRLAQEAVDTDAAWSSLPPALQNRVLYGPNGSPQDSSPEGTDDEPAPKTSRSRKKATPNAFEGVIPGLLHRAAELEAKRAQASGMDDMDDTLDFLESELERFRQRDVCEACGGARLNPVALAVQVDGRTFRDWTETPVEALLTMVERMALSGAAHAVGEPIRLEIAARLRFLVNVGLGYLTLGRAANTLSGGEAQRIRLGTQIGAGLVGVLYVLDEPTVGLHPKDIDQLRASLEALRDAGNTVLVVEHDLSLIQAADYVVEMGPGAGRLGGEVVSAGTPSEALSAPASLTGQYLREKPPQRREGARTPSGWLRIVDAQTHNLKQVTVQLPLGALTCVTGVSGSGKSSLIVDTLAPAARRALGRRGEGEAVGPTVQGRVEGLAGIDRVVEVDQRPVGRSPRSNPATYTGLFTPLRELFASLPEARARGYKAGRFSFNKKGGRCEACEGDGVRRVPMYFLPDVFVTCERCDGRRYNRETLSVRYRGHSIADILDLTVDEAFELLEVVPRLRDGLLALRSVGLGYIALGQSASTLSGGEAQRLKLATELARKDTGRTLYILDEPTTGLHLSDVDLLLSALEALVDRGNTAIVIAHDLWLAARADYVVDLGPDGGDGGGRIMAAGTPWEVARASGSHTARYLADLLRP